MSEISALEAIATTRSIHRFLPDPMPDADLARILYAATRAPSGTNRQPYRFLVLRDDASARQAKALLGESFRRSWAAKSAQEGWSADGVAPDSRKARTARSLQHFVDHFESIPVVVLVCMLRRRADNPYDGASVYPACQNLLLAARALGYGSTITVWHIACEQELRALLGIPPEVFIAATMPLGRPAGRHGPLRRMPVARTVFDGAWGRPAEWIADPPGARLSLVLAD